MVETPKREVGVLEEIEFGLVFGRSKEGQIDWQHIPSPMASEPSIFPVNDEKIPEIGGRLVLMVSVPKELVGRVQLFHIQGKQIILKSRSLESDWFKNFRTLVPIQRANRHSFVATAQAGGKDIDIPTTWYPQNCVYLAVFNPLGQVEVWCFSLVAQHGKFYAVIERTNQFQAYWDSARETVVFPDCEWPEFVAKILEPAFQGWVMELHGILPDVDGSKLKRAKEIAASLCPPVGDRVAVVKWFNACQGLGVVLLSDGSEVRIHWESIKEARYPNSDLLYLVPGDAVWFDKVGAPRQTGEHRTSFKHEVFGVTIKSLVG